jgi:hypothetical protein
MGARFLRKVAAVLARGLGILKGPYLKGALLAARQMQSSFYAGAA